MLVTEEAFLLYMLLKVEAMLWKIQCASTFNSVQIRDLSLINNRGGLSIGKNMNFRDHKKGVGVELNIAIFFFKICFKYTVSHKLYELTYKFDLPPPPL